MTIKCILATAAGIAAALASSGVAMAMDSPAASGSDHNLRYSRAYVERANDMLSHDQEDYGGHRVAAMNDISQARADIRAALRIDRNPDDAVIPSDFRAQDSDLATFERGQRASNRNIEFVDRYLERAIDMLKADAHDYDGYRAKAVSALQAARDQLRAAIEYRDAHPSGGGSMGAAGDKNLRFTRLYVERANDMLSNDKRDYGGHRVAAIGDLNQAREDLTAALRYDNVREDAAMPAHVMAGDEDLDAFFVRGQFASNQNIAYVRRYVERAIDMLQRDPHDYHGYRLKAVEHLQRARQQLDAALDFQKSH